MRFGQEVQALPRAARVAAPAAKAAAAIDRHKVRIAYRPEEERVSSERVAQARLGPADLKEAFNIGWDLSPDDPRVIAGEPFRGVNVWPGIQG